MLRWDTRPPEPRPLFLLAFPVLSALGMVIAELSWDWFGGGAWPSFSPVEYFFTGYTPFRFVTFGSIGLGFALSLLLFRSKLAQLVSSILFIALPWYGTLWLLGYLTPTPSNFLFVLLKYFQIGGIEGFLLTALGHLVFAIERGDGRRTGWRLGIMPMFVAAGMISELWMDEWPGEESETCWEYGFSSMWFYISLLALLAIDRAFCRRFPALLPPKSGVGNG